MKFQFKATSAAIPTAPATINPMDNGLTIPQQHKIMPSASIAKLIPTIRAALSFKKFWTFSTIKFQFKATSAAIPTAPATINPTDKALTIPQQHRITPSASMDRLTPTIRAALLLKNSDTFSVMKFQFKATSAAIPTAPTKIRPIDNGVTCPQQHIIIPITSMAMLTPIIKAAFSLKKFEIDSPIVSPLSEDASAIPHSVAPIKIKPMPQPIWPHINNIVPKAIKAAPVSLSAFSNFSFIFILSKPFRLSKSASVDLFASFCSWIRSNCSSSWSIISSFFSIFSSRTSNSLSSLSSERILISSKSAR